MYVIGLISGTSADGIDAALVEVSGTGYTLALTYIAGLTHPYPAELQQKILAVCAGEPLSMEDLAGLDDAIATAFAAAAQRLITPQHPVDLIASHGQTVFHRPPRRHPAPLQLGYSLQLGRGDLIAQQMGIPTVSNFRKADIALGGEGAPLVPPVDACLLSHPERHRCVQNIGGIGNVAYLPPWSPTKSPELPPVLAWDTGPGNSLIDIAVQRLSGGRQTYDAGGAWAAQGTPCHTLVEDWLSHPYFHQLPPKSTGRELFGWHYFEQCHQAAIAQGLSDADFLATLTEFTAASIAHSYRHFLPRLPDEVLLCGGGSHNQYLRQRLAHHLNGRPLLTTDAVGVPADYKEAIAFAILGYWRWQGVPGNLPSATGAAQAIPLGEIYQPAGTL